MGKIKFISIDFDINYPDSALVTFKIAKNTAIYDRIVAAYNKHTDEIEVK